MKFQRRIRYMWRFKRLGLRSAGYTVAHTLEVISHGPTEGIEPGLQSCVKKIFKFVVQLFGCTYICSQIAALWSCEEMYSRP